jgi:hypothetical protein
VFTGGWTLASAEAVSDPAALGSDLLDQLTSLLDQSLVRKAEAATGEPRFSMAGAHQGEWLDRCDLEPANLRAALRWVVNAGETRRAQDPAGAIWRFTRRP